MTKTLIPRREYFDRPERLSPAWTVTKGSRTARCEVWSSEFGFELRLLIESDDLPRTQVVGTQEALIALQEEWHAAMIGAGWTPARKG